MARGTLFDRKIGKEVWESLPALPGVYRYYDVAGRLIYVGKAKNLRRRLGQYRRARRLKAHQKMREILRRAARLEFTACATELEALELELATIQSYRPVFNVAGAYSFLYPYLIWHFESGRITIGYSLKISDASGHSRFGAFRSRHWAREATESLQFVLGYLGFGEKRPFGKRAFRFVRSEEAQRWAKLGETFLLGESAEFLSEIAVALLEKVAARRDAAEIQEHLRRLRLFWRQEALPLAQALSASGLKHPVAQEQRDRIFLKWRNSPPVDSKVLRQSRARAGQSEMPV